jgi:extradiol dioxygenase family protein
MAAVALAPFHLAFPVTDLEATRRFYSTVLGCPVGREAERWIDFDFFGHQISAHLADRPMGAVATSSVDGHGVPVPHFGLVLSWEEWEILAGRLRASAVEFVIEPYVRFAGQVGEQATMFFRDPCGNFLEVKAFRDRTASLFARA